MGETELAPHPELNLITGANASGKTSLLEAIFYLGRGRSFRASGNRELIQTGSSEFLLYGEALVGEDIHRTGIEVGIGRRQVRVDGANGSGADLARILPVQAIDPEVHQLIQGGPEFRRRFLDWGVFHVKHSFLESWRKYQRALRQRNAALRQGASDANVKAWDPELIEHGETVDSLRAAFLNDYLPLFSSIVIENLSFPSICSYKRGWSPNVGLGEELQNSWDRDRSLGSTQVGPHRADLSIAVQDRRARHRVSRGQQKMLAAALVISQARYVADTGTDRLVMLVDDPAAELDRDNRERLFAMLQDMPAQMFVTALEPGDLPWEGQGEMFHVEHGQVSSLV